MTAGAPLTYGAVGATQSPELMAAPPERFRPLERSSRLGVGEAKFRTASAAVLNWQLQTLSGFDIDPSPTPRAVVGDDVVLGIRWLFLRVRAPARVVYVIDEPRRSGFAYGTLPGHPESGEEAFIIQWRADDSVWLVLRAFSRPSTWVWRLGYPILRLTQEFYTRRYLTVLVGR